MKERPKTNDRERGDIFAFVNTTLEKNRGLIVIQADHDEDELQVMVHNASVYEIAMAVASLIQQKPLSILPLALKLMNQENEVKYG